MRLLTVVAISETPTTHQISTIDEGKKNWIKWQKSEIHQKKMHVKIQKHSPDKGSNSQVLRLQDLNGNLTQDEPKVPKKAKLISLKAYQWQSVSQI